MDVLTLLFRLPLVPLRGVIRIGELLRDEVDQQMHDPDIQLELTGPWPPYSFTGTDDDPASLTRNTP